MRALPIWRRLPRESVPRADCRARAMLGISRVIRMEMTITTTSSSGRVNPERSGRLSTGNCGLVAMSRGQPTVGAARG